MNSARLSQRAARSDRGFTLTELLVALTGGIFVAMAVFVLARDGARFYRNETRFSDATAGAITGFRRLTADVAQAGLLTTPQLQIPTGTGMDPHVCALPGAITELASVRLDQAASPVPTIVTDNLAKVRPSGRTVNPDRLTIAGAIGAPEMFPVAEVSQSTGTGYRAVLQTTEGPLFHLNFPNLPNTGAGSKEEILQRYFPVDRMLRIHNMQQKDQYGIITGYVVANGGGNPEVLLAANPPLLVTDTSVNSNTGRCAVKGGSTINGWVNVVRHYRYEIRSMATDTDYAPLYATPGPEGDADRTELVREEMSMAGGVPQTVIANTAQILAEYAVDFQVGATVVTNMTGGEPGPLLTYPPGDPNLMGVNGIGPVTSSNPRFARSLRIRLSVRSMVPDRAGAIDDFANYPDVAPGLYRFGVGASATAPFARVRTLQTDVALHNHTGLTW